MILAGGSQTFTYDHLNRVTSASTPVAWGNNFVYDAWGNLLQKQVTRGTAETLTVNANPSNQLMGYGYDLAGNMTNISGVLYNYDAENRAKGVNGVTYTYDGEGERVKKSSGTIYWGRGPLSESDLGGNILREFVYFNGKRIARRDTISGNVHYYFSDHRGSSNVVVNATGTQIENESDFYPFGGERVITQALPDQNYRFTGKERDADGLDYFGARYYSSTLGRFTSADWSAIPVPVPYADLGNPQTLNLYRYVENNPITGVDPDGHQAAGRDGVEHSDAMGNFGDPTMSMDTFEWHQENTDFLKAEIKGVWETTGGAAAQLGKDFINGMLFATLQERSH